MRHLLPSSTGRRVAGVVGLSVLFSYALAVGVWLWASPNSLLPGAARALAAELVSAVEVLDATPTDSREVVIDAFSITGLYVTPLPHGLPPGDGTEVGVMERVMRDRLAERGLQAELAVHAPKARPGADMVVLLRLQGGDAWRVTISPERMAVVLPNLLLPPMTLLLLLGVPLLLVMLWVASRITRPLAQLACAAEAIGAAGQGAALPETGTQEIRHLASAINSLVARLREDVASRTRLLAGISHDLRTPLTRMHLRVSTIGDPVLRGRVLADLAVMESLVGATLGLLETDLRQETAERIDLASLCSTVCDGFADAGRAVIYVGPLRCRMRGQPRALERALWNLVDNACKYAGGARLVLAGEAGRVTLAVEDDGPGIPDAEIPFVTEAFRRGDQLQEGFGLGLAIVASVARAHGGTLHLANRQPNGLRAELLLPVG